MLDAQPLENIQLDISQYLYSWRLDVRQVVFEYTATIGVETSLASVRCHPRAENLSS